MKQVKRQGTNTVGLHSFTVPKVVTIIESGSRRWSPWAGEGRQRGILPRYRDIGSGETSVLWMGSGRLHRSGKLPVPLAASLKGLGWRSWVELSGTALTQQERIHTHSIRAHAP